MHTHSFYALLKFEKYRLLAMIPLFAYFGAIQTWELAHQRSSNGMMMLWMLWLAVLFAFPEGFRFGKPITLVPLEFLFSQAVSKRTFFLLRSAMLYVACLTPATVVLIASDSIERALSLLVCSSACAVLLQTLFFTLWPWRFGALIAIVLYYITVFWVFPQPNTIPLLPASIGVVVAAIASFFYSRRRFLATEVIE